MRNRRLRVVAEQVELQRGRTWSHYGGTGHVPFMGVHGMFERFIPTSFTAVCHTSLIASAELEEPVVNDCRPTTVFTSSTVWQMQCSSDCSGVAVFGIYSLIGFQISFFLLSLLCVCTFMQTQTDLLQLTEKIKNTSVLPCARTLMFLLKVIAVQKKPCELSRLQAVQTRSKRTQKSSM